MAVAPNAAHGITANATELVTDYSVAGKVVDSLGLLSDPGLIKLYQSRSSNDKRDYRRFVEQIIIDNTKAKLLQDSNILEITYEANDPEQAKTFADAIRSAFIDATLEFKRQAANANAEWFDGQALKAKAALDAAISAETDYERANGLAMADDKTDVESARLRAMASEGAQTPPLPPALLSSTSAGTELAQVEGQIATQSKELGPNNPALQQLKAQRNALAATVAQERETQRAMAGASAAAANSVNRAVASQKAKVSPKATRSVDCRSYKPRWIFGATSSRRRRPGRRSSASKHCLLTWG